MEERSPKLKRNIVILSIISVVAVVVFLIVLIQMGMFTYTFVGETEQGTINQVLVKVEYEGSWQGAYGDTTFMTSWSGYGTKTVTIDRPEGVYWVVSANAQKQDDSNSLLTISILLLDGTVLKTASTTSPYGIAQVSQGID